MLIFSAQSVPYFYRRTLFHFLLFSLGLLLGFVLLQRPLGISCSVLLDKVTHAICPRASKKGILLQFCQLPHLGIEFFPRIDEVHHVRSTVIQR